jgi:hypothetical protein
LERLERINRRFLTRGILVTLAVTPSQASPKEKGVRATMIGVKPPGSRSGGVSNDYGHF